MYKDIIFRRIIQTVMMDVHMLPYDCKQDTKGESNGKI